MNERSSKAVQPLDDWLLQILACPACPQHHPVHLNDEKNGLICACGKYLFSISEEGIPNMLVEESTVLDENADPNSINSEVKS